MALDVWSSLPGTKQLIARHTGGRRIIIKKGNMEKEKTPVTTEPRDPFGDSAAPSMCADSYYSQRSEANRPAPKRRFESYRLRGEYEKPWATDKRLRRTRCGNYIIWGFIAAGLALSAFINFRATQKVPKNPVRQSVKLIRSSTFGPDPHLI